MLKKFVVHIRRSIKFTVLILISFLLIIGIVTFLYKPTYNVTINGEHVGYTSDRDTLQKRIDTYLSTGEGENVAFVQVPNLPQYKLCLLKKGIVTNDEEIFSKIKEQGITYYRYYAILENDEEKLYVSNFEDTENIINSLKEKNSVNINELSIVEKYETELQPLVSTDEAISKLYVEPVKTNVKLKRTYTSVGSVNTSLKTSASKTNIGINLIKPVSGIITSRFGASSRIRKSSHTGLDIATSKGTPVVAAASGTVTFAGTKGSYGNLLVITHSNGVQTYYGHCNSLNATVGQNVSQGQMIATVGSTGNSTGPHLHLEVRVNGVAYNPQNYVY